MSGASTSLLAAGLLSVAGAASASLATSVTLTTGGASAIPGSESAPDAEMTLPATTVPGAGVSSWANHGRVCSPGWLVADP